jgi:hypothetical protein
MLFFASVVGGTVHILAPEDVYVGGENRPLVLVELKLPSIGLNDMGARAAFITAATDVIDAMTVASHDRDNTWVNILNAPDGGWGLGGVAYTGEDLIAAVTASASAGAARPRTGIDRTPGGARLRPGWPGGPHQVRQPPSPA